MLRAVRSEFIKLRRLSVLAGGLSMTFFVVLAAGITLLRARQMPAPDQISIARLGVADGLAFILARGAQIIPVVALIIVAANMGAEYSQGTLRNLLVREPGRIRLVSGKFVGLLIFIAACGIVAVAAGIAVSLPLAPGRGVSTMQWTSPTGLHDVGTLIGGAALNTLAFAIFGLVIALLFRSAAAAVGVAFGWFGIGERLLAAVYNDLQKVLPGQLADALVTGGNQVVTFGEALIGTAGWVVVALLAGAFLLRRRDITS